MNDSMLRVRVSETSLKLLQTSAESFILVQRSYIFRFTRSTQLNAYLCARGVLVCLCAKSSRSISSKLRKIESLKLSLGRRTQKEVQKDIRRSLSTGSFLPLGDLAVCRAIFTEIGSALARAKRWVGREKQRVRYAVANFYYTARCPRCLQNFLDN